MKSSLSDKLNGGDIKVKKKKVKKSPLSDKYKRFLNNENINLNKKEKPTLDEIKINVIKKDPEKKPCKRKRVRIKDGKLNKKDVEHNKKCEENNTPPLSPPKKHKKTRKRRLSKRHTRGRRICLRSSKKKKGKNIKQEIQSAKNMSDDKIKQELLKNGIIIKGNQKQLMRDIYVFSNLGGINIRKE